ncbi:MAG TPA: hypothetical protein VGK22_08860 [Candidatus Angelobacter sp.]
MKYMRGMLLGAALIVGASSFAAAQAVVQVQWGAGYRDSDDRQAFNDGYKQGQWDARHNHRFDGDNNRWRERDDRRAFREGYERGFNEVGGGYREGPGFNGGGYGVKSARELGYQDGINDGALDRRTGHSYRPTHGDNFKHADRGYIPNYGNKNYYKDSYRDAYQSGYSQGYNSGVYERR